MFLQNFAQSAGECTVNGQPVDCGEAAQAAGGILAGFGIFMLLFFVFGIFSTIIWILSLIHLIQHEDVENRMVWILLVFLVPLANFVYYFGFRNKYEKQHSSTAQNQPVSSAAPGATPGVVAPTKEGSSDNNMSAGTVVGGAAGASSGFGLSDNQPEVPTETIADNSYQQPDIDIGSDSSDTSQGGSESIAQVDSAPVSSGEESSTGISEETTETSSTPDADSSQSGSTEETEFPSSSPSPQPSDDSSDDQNASGSSGPSIG